MLPNNNNYGVMLAYTPLHHLILRGNFIALIATSANVSDEPIVYKDRDAIEPKGNCRLLFSTQ